MLLGCVINVAINDKLTMNDELKTIRKEAVNTNQGTSLAHASSD
jgi:hypothetical protein